MGYLGLDGTEVKDDNLFQRLFWPSDHAGETDYLGKQGFWVCWAVAAISLLVLTLQGNLWVALLQFSFFALGGIGVREHDVPAAVLVATGYWINQIYGVFMGQFPGLIGLACGILLIANIRGTFIAKRWATYGDPEAFPERMNTTLIEQFSDRMPMVVWPKTRILFYCISGIYMLLVFFGLAMIVAKMLKG